MQVGQAKVLCQSAKDRVLLIGAGITLHEALAAAEELKKEGLYIYGYALGFGIKKISPK